MSTPAISVVIPVFNGTNYLREAVESVAAQTFTDYEIIIVDDGSTDATWELVTSFGSRVRGFRKPNGGVASALNLGIANARGRWVSWLSHDDLFLPTKLERQMALLTAEPRFHGCYTDYFVGDAEARIVRAVRTPWYPRVRAHRELFGRAYIGGSTIVVARSAFEAVGPFSESLRYTQDTDMWLRILRRFELGRVAEPLAVERWHPGQDSHRRDIMRAEAQRMYLAAFEAVSAAELFADQRPLSPPRDRARAHRWLADTMAAHRKWFDFADEHYGVAAALWPSWRNPARWRASLGARRLYWPMRAVVRLARSR